MKYKADLQTRHVLSGLKGVGVHLQEVSGVKLLSLLPLWAAGFFVFIHLAFALAGYALLMM